MDPPQTVSISFSKPATLFQRPQIRNHLQPDMENIVDLTHLDAYLICGNENNFW